MLGTSLPGYAPASMRPRLITAENDLGGLAQSAAMMLQ